MNSERCFICANFSLLQYLVISFHFYLVLSYFSPPNRVISSCWMPTSTAKEQMGKLALVGMRCITARIMTLAVQSTIAGFRFPSENVSLPGIPWNFLLMSCNHQCTTYLCDDYKWWIIRTARATHPRKRRFWCVLSVANAFVIVCNWNMFGLMMMILSGWCWCLLCDAITMCERLPQFLSHFL